MKDWQGFVVLAGFSVWGVASQAAVYQVPSDYGTIRQAMQAAVFGDSVLVLPGTYTNCDEGPCHPNVASLKEGVSLVSQGGPELTVLRVDTGTSSSGEVVRVAGIGSGGALVKGFTIMATASRYTGLVVFVAQNVRIEDCVFVDLDNGTLSGGGIFANGMTMEVSDCDFRRCVVVQEGSGIFGTNGSAALRACVFEDNVGKAVTFAGEAPWTDLEVRDCIFRNNQGFCSGGAMTVEFVGSVRIVGNEFVGNYSACGGGALAILSGSANPTWAALLENNVFAYNSTTPNGGALVWNTSGTMRNNLFYGNGGELGSAVRDIAPPGFQKEVTNNAFVGNVGGAAYAALTPPPTVGCNLFWGNLHGDFENYFAALTDVFADPEFCGPELEDFLVSASSPCLPENSNGCGQIGPFGQGCGSVSLVPTSWGRIKEIHRKR